MLRIGIPYLEQYDKKVRLCAKLTLAGQEQVIWYEVDRKYEQYLTVDRCDAFVISVLSIAMKLGEDIECEICVTKRLLYQLNHYLIPTLSRNTKRYKTISVVASPIETAKCQPKAIGVGWTGGIDCFYTYMKHQQECEYKISHLVVANIGTLEEGPLNETMELFVKRARSMADEQNLEVVAIDSNIHLLFKENYLSVAGFRLPAAILTMQGLFKVFLHSSGFSVADFSIDEADTSRFEMLILNCLETDSTVFYSSGSEVPRIEKLKALTDFDLAKRRLHTCVHPQDKNCGQCTKCQWLLAELYGFGKLDEFREVVDVDYFLENKETYLKKLAMKTDDFSTEAFELLKSKGLVPPAIIRLSKVVRRGMQLTDVTEIKIQELHKAVKNNYRSLAGTLLWEILVKEQGKQIVINEQERVKYSVKDKYLRVEDMGIELEQKNVTDILFGLIKQEDKEEFLENNVAIDEKIVYYIFKELKIILNRR